MSIVRNRNALQYFVQSLFICAALIYAPRPAFAQTTDSSGEQASAAETTSDTLPSPDQVSGNQQQSPTQSVICGVGHLGQCLKDIGHDQAGIWTSPLRIAPRDAFWLVPFAAGTGVALHYDAQAQQNLGMDKSRIDTSNIVSSFGSPYATLGGAAGLYFLGLGTHNEHLAETGRLGAEAVIDSLLVVEALKLGEPVKVSDRTHGRVDSLHEDIGVIFPLARTVPYDSQLRLQGSNENPTVQSR